MDKTLYVAHKVEVPANSFGLPTLVGKNVLIFTTTYIYYGFLAAMNCDMVSLENAHIVYETGPFGDSKFKDAQKMNMSPLFLSIGHIETIGESPKTV